MNGNGKLCGNVVRSRFLLSYVLLNKIFGNMPYMILNGEDLGYFVRFENVL